MIDTFVKLKDFVPFFQTFIWIILVFFAICTFKKNINDLIDILCKKIEKGGKVKIGPLELGEDLLSLELIDNKSKSDTKPIIGSEGEEREKQRVSIYERNKGLFITHIIYPSYHDDGDYENFDIFIYLIRHKSNNYCDVEKAEFFFGHMWNNQIFRVKSRDGLIGIRTSAYKPFLCTCKVKFTDGTEVVLDRYIDFEMTKLLKD